MASSEHIDTITIHDDVSVNKQPLSTIQHDSLRQNSPQQLTDNYYNLFRINNIQIRRSSFGHRLGWCIGFSGRHLHGGSIHFIFSDLCAAAVNLHCDCICHTSGGTDNRCIERRQLSRRTIHTSMDDCIRRNVGRMRCDHCVLSN